MFPSARHIALLSLAVLLLNLTGGPASAQSRLANAPQQLLEQPGVERKDGLLYATGQAEPGAYRDDKAQESARHKSLARALQMVHAASSSLELLDALAPDEAAIFLHELSRATPTLSLTGVEVLRQWEQDGRHLTLVSVPLKLVERTPPAFANMDTAIRAYLDLPDHSLDGLHFCLTRASPHTRDHAQARRLAAEMLRGQGRPGLAAAIDPATSLPAWADSPMAPLLARQAWAWAERDFAKLHPHPLGVQADQLLAGLDAILQIAPDHAPSLRLLADIWLEQGRPGLALAAVGESLRDGMDPEKGLERMVRALEAMRSPEAEVFTFLRSQDIPSAWNQSNDDPRLTPEARLIMASLGRAMVGPPQSNSPFADTTYSAARKQFDQANTNADLEQVLATLFQASATEPGNPEVHNLTGATLRLLDQPLEALPFLWQALRLSPDHDLALTNLALCCKALGLEQAAEFYRSHRAVRESEHPWVREQVEKWRGERQPPAPDGRSSREGRKVDAKKRKNFCSAGKEQQSKRLLALRPQHHPVRGEAIFFKTHLSCALKMFPLCVSTFLTFAA